MIHQCQIKDMRTCSNCGAPLEDGAQFCTECGTKVTSSQKICPHCGAVTDDDSLFCSECGAQLEVVQQFTPEQPVVEPLSNMKTNTRSSSDNIIPPAKKDNNTLLYVVGIIMAVILLAFGGNFVYKYYMDKQNDSYDTNQYNQESSNSYDNTDNLVFDYDAEVGQGDKTDSEKSAVESVDEQQDNNDSVNVQNESNNEIVQGSETEEETAAEIVEQKPVVQHKTRKYPSVEVPQSGLISARLNNVDYNKGQVKVVIVVRTPMVRRQFSVTGAFARDGNDQNASVSDVEIAGISKERGHDYYIITNNDTVYLTVVIPQMPVSGSLNFVRVNMSLSGSIQWVTVKNINW